MARRRVVFLSCSVLTIPAANWMIGNVGTVCVAATARASFRCFGAVELMAPSGVLMIGVAPGAARSACSGGSASSSPSPRSSIGAALSSVYSRAACARDRRRRWRFCCRSSPTLAVYTPLARSAAS